jgi:hypothetical protein
VEVTLSVPFDARLRLLLKVPGHADSAYLLHQNTVRLSRRQLWCSEIASFEGVHLRWNKF